jgi:antitoxin ParD1/3/4
MRDWAREKACADQDRRHLRRLLLEGASSAPTEPLDETYFDGLRERVRRLRAG